MSILDKIAKQPKLIAGIGSALIDILAYADDEFLNKISDVKGGMILVNKEFIHDTLSELKTKQTVVPGGATCNMIIGIGKLGGKARFIGKRGDDELGNLFESDLRSDNVETKLITANESTGKVLSLITPDAQRSMFTFLGAAASMLPSDISEECFFGAGIVIVEGYLLFNKELMLAALKAAKAVGALIVLDLSSFTVVQQAKDFLINEVISYIDILIANEDEAKAFTGIEDELPALEALAKYADIAVLKVGKKGSYISCDGIVTKVARTGDGVAVDTTGAGDLWAAGFLFGLIHGYSLEKCGAIASACGYEVCQVVGANIPNGGWKRIKELL